MAALRSGMAGVGLLKRAGALLRLQVYPWVTETGSRHVVRRKFQEGVVTTVGELCQKWSSHLSVYNVPECETSAKLIIASVLHQPTLHHIPDDMPLTSDQVVEVNLKCEQRLQRKPLQYIIGEWDFCDLTLKMDPPVFIPRPETEGLVNLIVESMTSQQTNRRFLEIGSGSGAISLSLLHRLPNWTCVATDITSAACTLTTENSLKLNMTDRIAVVKHDITQDLSVLQMLSPFDFIVSNPPYLSEEDMKLLEPELLWFEDHQALCGGEDGQNMIRSVLKASQHLVRPGGSLWLEVNSDHVEDVTRWVAAGHVQLQFQDGYQDFMGRFTLVLTK